MIVLLYYEISVSSDESHGISGSKKLKDYPAFGKHDLKIEQQSPLYSGFFKLINYQFRHKLFAGGWSGVVNREILERGHAVAMLLYDPILNDFVFIEQFRVGALPTSKSPWLIEIVAGMIDKDEEPEDVCRREAIEEAGVTVKNLHKALSFLSSPGGTTERIHVYVGEVDATQAKGIHGLDYENEDILVRRVSEKQAIEWLETGVIDNATAVISMQWFLLNKQKLLDEWRSN